MPEGTRQEAEKALLSRYKSEEPGPQPLSRYVIWQIAIALAALFFFILFEYHLHPAQQWLIAICIIITLINCGAIMEQKRWIVYLEMSRLVIASSALLYVYFNPVLILLALVTLSIMIYYFDTIQKHYLRLVYANMRE